MRQLCKAGTVVPKTTLIRSAFARGVMFYSDDFADEAGFTRIAQATMAGKHKSWTIPGRFTVLYDGQCPLCDREISHYKSLKSDIVFLNLFDGEHQASVEELAERCGFDIETAKARMHVIMEDDSVVRNAEAFREMWRRLPFPWSALPIFLDNAPAMAVANRLYDVWITKRNKRAAPGSVCAK